MDDAVEFVDDVRLGVGEVLPVELDVGKQVLDLVLDLVFLAVGLGVTGVCLRHEAGRGQGMKHFNRHFHFTAACRATQDEKSSSAIGGNETGSGCRIMRTLPLRRILAANFRWLRR